MEVDFKINIGEYEVLESGVVITHLDKGIQFHINGLTFDISFKENKEENTKINASVSDTDPKHLNIELVNYDNNLGQGLIEPAEVGTINEKSIYLHFETSKLGNTKTRTFTYTWLIK